MPEHANQLTAQWLKEQAKKYGADLCGIADIARFDGVEPMRNPKSILPKAKCVIGFGFRVPRALYHVMENDAQFMSYVSLGVKYIDEDLSEIFLLRMGGLIEDFGYDACLQRNVSNLRIKGDKSTNPELIDTYELQFAEAVAPGKPTPDVIMDFSFAAVACGLGSIGQRGNVLTPRFGPFVRFVFIITDAPLETDAPFAGELCDHCGLCAAACPGQAIGERGLDSWQCAVTYRGANSINPMITEDTLKDEPEREQILAGEKRFDAVSARAIYPKLSFLPSKTTGYVACLCKKACDMACYKHLKEKGALV